MNPRLTTAAPLALSAVFAKILYELCEDVAKGGVETSNLQHYGPGVRACLELEKELGEAGLIEAVQSGESFPLGWL